MTYTITLRDENGAIIHVKEGTDLDRLERGGEGAVMSGYRGTASASIANESGEQVWYLES